MESGAPFGSNVAHVHDSLGIIGVDVEDWRVDDASHVRAVRGGSRVARIGRETNLVVGYNVDCTTGRVVWEIRQGERLIDDTLARESCVAVQKN